MKIGSKDSDGGGRGHPASGNFNKFGITRIIEKMLGVGNCGRKAPSNQIVVMHKYLEGFMAAREKYIKCTSDCQQLQVRQHPRLESQP